MKKSNKKLNLNKKSITNLNTIAGGVAPISSDFSCMPGDTGNEGSGMPCTDVICGTYTNLNCYTTVIDYSRPGWGASCAPSCGNCGTINCNPTVC